MKNPLRALVTSAVFVFGISGSVAAATCSSFAPTITYDAFSSCTVSGGGPAGQDSFANVSAIVNNLFGDEGISIDALFSFSPGPGTGSEFGTSALGVGNGNNGFETQQSALNLSQYTFNSLPTGTQFLTIKAGNGYELFGLSGLNTPFTLTRSVSNNVSHMSTFGSDMAAVPLPGSLSLLFGALGLTLLARRRRAV